MDSRLRDFFIWNLNYNSENEVNRNRRNYFNPANYMQKLCEINMDVFIILNIRGIYFLGYFIGLSNRG